jgi:hypothetical protein
LEICNLSNGNRLFLRLMAAPDEVWIMTSPSSDSGQTWRPMPKSTGHHLRLTEKTIKCWRCLMSNVLQIWWVMSWCIPVGCCTRREEYRLLRKLFKFHPIGIEWKFYETFNWFRVIQEEDWSRERKLHFLKCSHNTYNFRY